MSENQNRRQIEIYDANGSVIAAVPAIEYSPEGWPYYYENGKHAGYFIKGIVVRFESQFQKC